MSLAIAACTLGQANDFVHEHHRHHRPVAGHKFSIAALDGGEVVGVVIVGRPVARALDDGRAVEVLRCCTDGTRNACSFLYGAATRAARALGYAMIGTYTLPAEGGASLRGAGWAPVHLTKNTRGWDAKSRRRDNTRHPLGEKQRWQCQLRQDACP